MTTASIIVKDLTVRQQGNTMLDALSFQVERNENLAITGDSGSGKTTLAKALAGRIFYTGSIVFGSPNPVIGFVEQHYHFKNRSNTTDFYYQQRYNSIDSSDAPTVLEELRSTNADDNSIMQLLTRLQLEHRSKSSLLHLSSGEHKRFQLIKSLLLPCEILILDEPFIGLDGRSRQELNQILEEITERGIQVILITDSHEVPSCIRTILRLQKGSPVSFTQTASIAFQPETSKKYAFPSILPVDKTRWGFTVAVKMTDVSVRYGEKTILSAINWEVRKGEKWQLKGRNGVGKSTLLSLITGDHPQAYANDISLFDRKRGTGESIWDIKKKIGYVSPELHWYFDTSVTVYETVASGFYDTIGLYKKPTRNEHERIEQWLDLLHFSHVQNKPVSTISSSEQRLTLLLRALVKDPPLLLLDEPCQGLDETQTADFVELVDTLCERMDKTLIYISHYDHEIPSCIKKVLELEEGHYKTYSRRMETAVAV